MSEAELATNAADLDLRREKLILSSDLTEERLKALSLNEANALR